MRSGLDVAEATDLERRLCAASGGDVPLARLLPEHSAGIYASPFRWLGGLTKPSPRAPETMVRFLSEKSVARQCKGRRPSWLPHLAALFGPTRERPRAWLELLARTHIPWRPDALSVHEVALSFPRELFVDGSVMRTGKGGWAAVCTHPAGMPLLPDGGQGISGSARTFGASAITSGTMEILALREGVRMAPHNDLRIYSDYQRSVQSWRALAKLDTRALIRGADAPLLMDLARMKAARKALGLSTKVEKVAAHGRCASQAQALTDGNALADLAAKRAARADEPDPLDLSSAYVRGGPPFLLTLDGLPVYADARRAARRHVGKLRAERWQNLPTHGLLERLLRFAWPPSVEYSSSKAALAAPPRSSYAGGCCA